MDDKFFRQLNPGEEEQFRQWARDNFDPNVDREPIWHPVVRDEWKTLVELELSPNFGDGLTDQAAA